MSRVTPEGKIKKAVKKLLDEYEGVYRFMPVQMGFGEVTLDFLCCCKGLFFAIETKVPGHHLTLRQQNTADRMRAAGAQVFAISDEHGLDKLKTYLDLLNAARK